MPRRPKRDRAAQIAASLPKDDRFSAHPNESIDVVYVIGRAAHLVGARPKEVGGVMLASLALSVIPLLGARAAGAFEQEQPLLTLMTVLVAWSFGLLLQTPLVGAAIEVHTDREGLAPEFLRRGLANFGPIIAASAAVLAIEAVVATVAVFLYIGLGKLVASLPLGFVGFDLMIVGAVVLVVLALRIITAFSLVVPIILVEGLGAGAALARSWAIGWRNGTSIFLALLLPALVSWFVLYLAGYMPWFINVPLAIVLGLLLTLYNSAVVPAAYVVIREYVHGLDPAHLLDRKPRR